MQPYHQIMRPYTVVGPTQNKMPPQKLTSSQPGGIIGPSQLNLIGQHQGIQQPQQQQLSFAQNTSQQTQHQQGQQINGQSLIGQGQQQQYFVPKKVIENYSYCLPDVIGKGYSSQVYRGKNEQTGEVVAVKVIDMKGIKNEVQSFLLKNEINVLRKLNSNINCLKLLDVFHTANNTYLITEFCGHGDLKDLIQKYGTFSERPAVRILKHLLNGLQEMQDKGIIHRDLKLANILVRDGIPKIADFGFSKDINGEPCKIYYNVGTPMYMSPQSLMKNEYSFKSDIWSIGVLFYEMIYGNTPWMAETEQQLVDKMTTIPVSFPQTPSVSEESKEFIRRCLQIEESKRFSLSEMINHPLFNILDKKDDKSTSNNIITSSTTVTQSSISNTATNATNNKIDKTPDNKNKENLTALSPNPQMAIKQADFSPVPTKSKVMQEKVQVQGSYPGFTKTPNSENFQKQYTPLSPKMKEANTFGNNELNKQSIQRISGQQQQVHPQQQQFQQQQQGGQQIQQQQQPDNVEEFSQNDQIVLAQINFCRFLYRLHKFCGESHAFRTDGLQEKISYLIMKNIMIKINRLQSLSDQRINAFNLVDFNNYLQEDSFGRFQLVIRQYVSKYTNAFNYLLQQIQFKNDLLHQDAKFAAIYDQSFIELETFYIIAQGYLRAATHELYSPLTQQLSNIETGQQIPNEHQSTVVFLDYLITYFQLSQLILENFNQYDLFARVSKIESIAEGQPVTLSKFHFTSIQNKILSLKI